jgi:hypothetical protein
VADTVIMFISPFVHSGLYPSPTDLNYNDIPAGVKPRFSL